MKKSIEKIIYTFMLIAVAVLSSVFIFAPEGVASANSAWFKYDGVNSVGAIIKGENCPIVVDREDLTFDIYQDDIGGFYEYENPAGKVSAKYTFRNPTDITAKVELIFPFGYTPEYYRNEPDDGRDNKKYYSVSADGEDIPKRIRNTYRPRRENYDIVQFDLAEDTKYLSDDYLQKDGLSADTKMYEYVCRTQNVGVAQEEIIVYLYDNDSQILCKVESKVYTSNSYTSANVLCDEEGNATFYSFKELASDEIECRSCNYHDSTIYDLELVKETTLLNAVLAFRDETDEVEDADWYNAFVARYDKNVKFVHPYFENDCRFRWYDYTLEFAPYQTIVNEVVAPLYPHVEQDYSPRVLYYTYLLSPAKSWASFGEFHLHINTDMHVKDVSIGKMEKCDGYYEYSCQGLPDGELTFGICKSVAPVKLSVKRGFLIAGIVLALTSVIWIPIVAVIIVKVRKKRIEKKVMQSQNVQRPVYRQVPRNGYYGNSYDGKSNIDDQTRRNKRRK